VADIAQSAGHAQDVHGVRQALPLQNLMGARILFDRVEVLAVVLGLPSTCQV
jgi:hypothetical protein